MNGLAPQRGRGSTSLAIGAIGLLSSVAVLFASVAGLVDHDHGFAAEPAGFDCSLDHGSEALSGEPVSDAELHRGAQGHRHQCLGCKLSGQRCLTASADGALVGRADSRRTAPGALALRRAPGLWAGATLRGPPIS